MTVSNATPKPSSTQSLTTVREGLAQTGFLSKLFTQGANGISPAQITMEFSAVLKLIGVQLSPGTQITLDSAQVILAGGTFINDLNEGASTLQCVGDLSIGIAGIADILSVLHLLDPQVSDFIGLGTNTALVLASGGTNILADIGLVISLINCVMDIGNDLFGSGAAAKKQAQSMLANDVATYLNPQVNAAAAQIKAYTQGSMTVFDLVGNIARLSPIELPGLFPQIATYFPSWTTVQFSETGKSSGLFSTQYDTERATFIQLVVSKKQVQDVLVKLYLTDPMVPFETFETVAPVISLKAISVLSLLMATGTAGDKVMSFDFSIIGALQGLGLTPYRLGDDWLFKGLQRNENDLEDWVHTLPYPTLTVPLVEPQTSGVTIGGQAYLTPSEISNNAKADQIVALQKKMQALDQAGDIEGLLQIPEAVAILSRWANIHVDPVFYSQNQLNQDLSDYNTKMGLLRNELSQAQATLSTTPQDIITVNGIYKEIAALKRPSTPVGEITNMKLIGTSITTQAWYSITMSTDPATPSGQMFWAYLNKNYVLDMSDYWKCLQVLKTMKSSNLFSDDLDIQSRLDSMQSIEDQFLKTHDFFMKKQLNILARKNLASRLNIPYNQLGSRYDSKGNLIFYQKVS